MFGSFKVRELTGRHVLYILIAFFGLMFVVNGVFVYFALNSFSGLSVSDSYNRGLHYNEEIARLEDQRRRDWHAGFVFESKEGAVGTFTFNVLNSSGRPVTFTRVDLAISRPAREDLDVSLPVERVNGTYIVEYTFPAAGQWDVTLIAEGGGYDTPYRLEKRIWVK
ncbi:FixH family protein [Sneathiella chinensis]|uniref:Nitrogen fixation protein FixH n=1 Tax=Sneathiella chinensis TaxID=349750 RepID=A0ABQ5U2S0_9PROT|nr:FixH family protein [Sneathiella chinensis]GLQ05986.1 hypothetical protein GCM10007924_12070 [Sneathiella chinensis]